MYASNTSLTLLVGVVMVRFFPETLLLRMRLKLCLKDFFKDLTLDRGPSIARESLGCSVHLMREQQHDASVLLNLINSIKSNTFHFDFIHMHKK